MEHQTKNASEVLRKRAKTSSKDDKPERGRKRGAEDEPDDPRLANTDGAQVVTVEDEPDKDEGGDDNEGTNAMLESVGKSKESRWQLIESIGANEYTSLWEVTDMLYNVRMTESCASVRNGHTDTDEVARPREETDEDSREARGHTETPVNSVGRWERVPDSRRMPREVRSHPGPIMSRNNVPARDLQWRDIGSGAFAKTFLGATRLINTTSSGPPKSDIWRRTVRCLRTGKVIDSCVVNDVSDWELNRKLPEPTDIRVEVEVIGALDIFKKVGGDVVDIYILNRELHRLPR